MSITITASDEEWEDCGRALIYWLTHAEGLDDEARDRAIGLAVMVAPEDLRDQLHELALEWQSRETPTSRRIVS